MGTVKGAIGSGEGIFLDEVACSGAGDGEGKGEGSARWTCLAGVCEGVLSKYGSISISSFSCVGVSIRTDLDDGSPFVRT